MRWQRATRCGGRSLVETATGRYKHLIGPKLRAQSLSNQRGEAALAVALLNRMIPTANLSPAAAPEGRYQNGVARPLVNPCNNATLLQTEGTGRPDHCLQSEQRAEAYMTFKNSGRIQFSLSRNENASGIFSHENASDNYILTAPMCQGIVTLENKSGLIYDGKVRPGMLRLLAPGERVRVTTRSRSATLLVSIPGNTFRAIDADYASRRQRDGLSLVRPMLEPNCHVETLTRTFTAVNELGAGHRQLFVDGLAHSLLALLLDAQAQRSDTVHRGSTGGLSNAQMMRCVDYAEASLGQALDLTTWAATVDMSVREFAWCFRQKTLVSPYAWFMNRRISRAKEMLSQTELPIVEVALQVGFCSQSHFTEAFRRRVGLSPGHWRDRYGSGGS